ncbi:MAG: hypothetical protein K8S87_08585 [Planctomycetes bacterium]|nr:hypothetical protein [Planctomycetota bacterium]
MRLLIRIIITSALIFFGVYFLGQDAMDNNESINNELFGLMLLISAWIFNIWLSPKPKGVNVAAFLNKELERNIKKLEREVAENSLPSTKLELAEMHIKFNKSDKAIKFLDEYDAEIPDNLHSFYLRIIACHGNKDFKTAWQYIDKVFKKDPNYDDHRIKLWAARCYIELLEPENALQMIDEFTKNAGFVAEAYYVKGIAYARIGNIEKAELQQKELEQLSSKVQKVRALEIQIFSKALQKEIEDAKSQISADKTAKLT